MKRWYRVHFLGIETVISLGFIAIIIYAVNEFWSVDEFEQSLYSIRDVLYGTIAALSGAMLGFVITGLSVLLTTSSNQQIERLKRSKHYKTIYVIFFSTSKYLGLLLVISLLSLIFDKDSNGQVVFPLLTLWALIIVAFRVFRCIWVLEKIVDLHIQGK